MILSQGMLAGALNIGLYLLAYFIAPRSLFHPALFWLGLIFVLAVMVRAGRREASRQAFYPFRTALRTGFGIFAVSTVLFQLFYLLLIYVIDPGLIDLQFEVMLESARWVQETFGLESPETGLDKAQLAFSFSGTLLALARNLIGGFVLAAALALWLKSPAELAEK